LRDRLIDLVLLFVLILAAGAVGWTLLSLGKPSTQSFYEPPDAANSDSVAFGIQPIDLGVKGDPSGLPPVLNGEGLVVEEISSEDNRSVLQEVMNDDPIILERIGFSFVTGGSGACGVVLEPWRHVAVSRELLESLGCGTEISIGFDSPRGGQEKITAVVGDTMNPSHYRTVNVFVGQEEPALEYGVTSGWLER
jgi:hypothetical protein|tara:strand:- start:104 stop:685 length:582 start_codon:yes stop_codon:yes gene_type:complete